MGYTLTAVFVTAMGTVASFGIIARAEANAAEKENTKVKD